MGMGPLREEIERIEGGGVGVWELLGHDYDVHARLSVVVECKV